MRPRAHLLGLVAAAVALTPVSAVAQAPSVTPPKIPDWSQGQPIPLGYHTEPRMRRGLVVAGSVVFVSLYVTTVVPSVTAGGSAWVGAIPVGGPFGLLYLATRPPPPKTDDTCACLALDVLLAVDGVLQAAGAAMFIAGLVTRPVLVSNEAIEARVVPVPLTFGKNGGGIGLAGTF